MVLSSKTDADTGEFIQQKEIAASNGINDLI